MWFERIASQQVQHRLRRTGAVLLEGPKACGKTSLAQRFAESAVMLDRDAAMRLAAQTDPSLILDGPHPRLLDEYQLIDGLWDAVRGHIDDVGGKGMFILTGSATPDDRHPTTGRRHTGARRISPVRLRTLSWTERGLSSGVVSVADLLSGTGPPTGDVGRITVADATAAICVGGWPDAQGLSVDDAIGANSDYLDVIVEADVERADGVARDPMLVRRFIASWARNVATDATLATLARIGDDHTLSEDARHAYLRVLTRLFLIEDQPAWKPSLRSRARLRSTPKRHLTDPSLAVAALGAHPQRLLGPEIELTGFLFESQVVHDLRVYADAATATVGFYRDSNNLEVDAVVEARDGRWAAFEVKLGVRTIDGAAASLLKLNQVVDNRTSDLCQALVVITADSPTYRRDDGVIVTSVAALGP